ncbi:MAG: ROK family protein [Chloroflexota bacterium]
MSRPAAPDRTVTAGIDVGGTKVAGALVDTDGRVVARVRRSALVGARGDPGLRVTRAVAEALLARAAALGLVVEGIGAGFPEYVTPDGRLTSHEVLAWRTQPTALLADLGPVSVGSDVRCAALAEARLGAGRGVGSFLYVSLGTGISSTLVLGGSPWAGARGEAIALGELPLAGEPGARLEPFASGEGIRRRDAVLRGSDPGSARAVVAAARAGDPMAHAVVTSAGAATGAALATLVRLLDPALVVLGGGLAGAGDPWRGALRAALRAGLAGRPHPPRLRRAALGRDAGSVGAALLHRERIGATGDPRS